MIGALALSAVSHFGGFNNNKPTTHTSAVIRTPDWRPMVTPGAFVYSWVMEHGDARPNPWLIQVGWATGAAYARPVVATYASVGGPGGWAVYAEHPEIALSAGSDHAYAVVHTHDDTWAVTVDGHTTETFDVPSGPTGLAEAFLESNDPALAIPDIRFGSVDVGGDCWVSGDSEFTTLGRNGCSELYVRRAS